VRTDAIFYQLFKRFPSLFFSPIQHRPDNPQNYRFESVEIKETAFRIDGVFLPPINAPQKHIFFTEVQFQQNENLYHRFFTESLLYLFRSADQYDDWYGVIIFAKRSLEPKDTRTHRALLNSSQVQRIFLDDLDTNNPQPIGIQLMQLIIMSRKKAAAQAKQLIQQAQQNDIAPFKKQEIIDLITTIAVYKFSKLSRQEVEAMIGLQLEETRIYQEAKTEGKLEGKAEGKLEGKAEGKLEEGRSLVLRQLNRRIGRVPSKLECAVQGLTLEQIETLSEALLDFSDEADLSNWLQIHS
jgi:predicted transposase/invertase (TIGR01784 family)